MTWGKICFISNIFGSSIDQLNPPKQLTNKTWKDLITYTQEYYSDVLLPYKGNLLPSSGENYTSKWINCLQSADTSPACSMSSILLIALQ